MIGLISPRAGLFSSLRGVVFICLIAVIIYSGFVALGWMYILALNLGPIVFLGLFIDMVTRLIDEPICEEPAFRGYIYRNLNSRLACWQAMLGQVGCFTLLGAFLVGFFSIISLIQGQPVSYPPLVIVLYLVALALFGCLLQLCMLITGNLWMGIGLHLFAIEFPIGFVTPSKGV